MTRRFAPPLALGVALALVLAAPAGARAQADAPAPSTVLGETGAETARLPMERIVAVVAEADLNDIHSIGREHGRYAIKARDSAGRMVEVLLDPATGRLVPDPETGKPLIKRVAGLDAPGSYLSAKQILGTVAAAGYPDVYAIEREHAIYEVMVYDADGRKLELYLHPKTGELLRDPRTGEPLVERIDE